MSDASVVDVAVLDRVAARMQAMDTQVEAWLRPLPQMRVLEQVPTDAR